MQELAELISVNFDITVSITIYVLIHLELKSIVKRLKKLENAEISIKPKKAQKRVLNALSTLARMFVSK